MTIPISTKLGVGNAASVGIADEVIAVTEEVIVAINEIIAGTLDGLIANTVDITIDGIPAAATILIFISLQYIHRRYMSYRHRDIVRVNVPIGRGSVSATGIPEAISLAVCGIRAAFRV